MPKYFTAIFSINKAMLEEEENEEEMHQKGGKLCLSMNVFCVDISFHVILQFQKGSFT